MLAILSQSVAIIDSDTAEKVSPVAILQTSPRVSLSMAIIDINNSEFIGYTNGPTNGIVTWTHGRGVSSAVMTLSRAGTGAAEITDICRKIPSISLQTVSWFSRR